MNKVLKGFLSLGLAIAMCFGIVAIERGVSTEYNVAYAAEGSYYSGITATSGQQLLGQVHDLITITHKKYTSYSDCKNPTYVKMTDPGSNSSSVMEFYSQANISSTWGAGAVGTWNREHVWCQSLSNGLWGESGGGSDMHHIRPVETRLNSTRGNDKYGLVSNRDSNKAYYKDGSGNNVAHGGYSGGSVFEPLDEVKGDVARIVMYVYTHYNTYSNVGGTTNGSGSYFGTLKFTNVMSASSETAAINLLLEWNKNDPVDDIERTRNEAVYEIQGNRNPFIDHPEYVNAIWGNGTVTPGPGGNTSTELTGLTMSQTSVSLTVGQTKTLSVTATPVGASNAVNWSTSNSNVASVSSNGLVTAKAEGTATITATSTTNSNIKATATVTVTKASSTVPTDSATININSFSSLSGSYGFQSWSSGGIGGIAYIYGAEKSCMQFNSSKASYYIASNTASSAPIKEVTVKLNSKTSSSKDWKLLTSTTPYGEINVKPTSGNDQGTKTVTTSGVTWTLTGNDTYFALTYESTGACYLESIVVTFGNNSDVGGGDEQHVCEHVCATCHKCTDKNCTDPVCREKCAGHGDEQQHVCKHVCDTCHKCTDKNCTDPVCTEKCAGHGGEQQPGVDYERLQSFHSAVESIISSKTLTQKFKAINDAILVYRELTATEKELSIGDVEILRLAINEYNQTVGAYNDNAKIINGAVIGG